MCVSVFSLYSRAFFCLFVGFTLHCEAFFEGEGGDVFFVCITSVLSLYSQVFFCHPRYVVGGIYAQMSHISSYLFRPLVVCVELLFTLLNKTV